MPVTGGDVLARNLRQFGGGFIKHVNKTMTHVAKMLDEEVTNNINLQDHDLAALRRLGHPYRVGGPGLHEPEGYKVHIQSGQMFSAKKSGIKEADVTTGVLRTSAFAGVDASLAPHVLHVFYGSTRMMPRDFLTPALQAAKEPALAFLKSNLAHLVFNFKSAKQ